MNKRLVSLDIFRGITIASMIMVNQPGSWNFKYDQMRHAQWHGCTLTDLIFSFFLLIMGIACWFSYQKYDQKISLNLIKKIVRRSLLIIIIGLSLNFFKQWINLGEVDLSTLRFTGVLQRIGICYGIGASLCLALNSRGVVIASFFILFSYWMILYSAGVPEPYIAENSIVGKIDTLIIG